ncbi:hypothetical protein G9A89_001836 [Geosiphon pyriformis]|nr:hypothetical protein G9A89_001836 [Geosiphon pyriformis]
MSVTNRYNQVTRGSNKRVTRVKVVTPILKDMVIPADPEKSWNNQKSCFRCKESKNYVKMLASRLGGIEELVNNLSDFISETSVEKYSHSHDKIQKIGNNFPAKKLYHDLKLSDHMDLDFSRFSLDDLQDLVKNATSSTTLYRNFSFQSQQIMLTESDLSDEPLTPKEEYFQIDPPIKIENHCNNPLIYQTV